MNGIELNQHKNNIRDLIHQIIVSTQGIDINDFRVNEDLKETVHSQLQEIGQASYEIYTYSNEDTMTYQKLSLLRNARYHQEAELDINSIWAIIKRDLPEFDELISSEVTTQE